MTPSDRVAQLRAAAAADALHEARRHARRRWWLALAAVVYAVLLGVVLFWPVHVDGEGGFVRFDAALEVLARLGIPNFWRYMLLESSSNAALFLPLGALWAAWSPTPRYWRVLSAAGIGAAVSLAAEMVQQAFLPDRTFDLRDIVANTVGAAIGALIVVVIAGAARRSAAVSRATSG